MPRANQAPKIERRRKPQPDPYTSKIVKPPTKRHCEDALRHAVTHRDADALEDWDEWDFDA